MKNLTIFGGTGGLGKQISENLNTLFNVTSLGSQDVDITNYSEVKDYFESNKVDIVLNFSGLNYDCFMHKYSEDNIHKIDELLNVNLKGTTNILSCCLPQMREQRYGRIILISSILAESPVISTGVYAGCKGFLDSIAKTVALENAAKGITCNTIQLGYFDGGLTYKIPENVLDQIIQSIPLKRTGTIDELSKLIESLIAIEYITGTSIKMNGGLDF